MPTCEGNVRLSKRKHFQRWLQSHTCYDNVQSNATINDSIRYDNLTRVDDGCRQQLCIENCSQTASDRDMVTKWQPTGNRHSPIQQYHRWPSMLYRLATIPRDCHSRVYNDPSRSPKVDDFHVIWKDLCRFLSAISGNLGPISHRFRDTTTYQLKMQIFPTPFVSPQIWKSSPWTGLLKLCMQRSAAPD